MRTLAAPVILSLFFVACQLPPAPRGYLCPSQDPAFSHGKVEIAQFSQTVEAEPLSLQASSPSFHIGKTFLPAETSLTAVIDEGCVQQNRVENAPLSNEITKGQGLTSLVRSHSWTLTRPISRPELVRLAEADMCLMGLSNEVMQSTSSISMDPLISVQSHLGYLGVLDSLAEITRLEGLIDRDLVWAVIDTGIDESQEDLVSNLWVNQNEIANNQLDDDFNGYIDDRSGYNFATMRPSPQFDPQNPKGPHGTHVTGLGAARFGNSRGGTGIMGQHVKIMPLNVFGQNGEVRSSVIDNAIRYAADNGADVINLSVAGTGPSTAQKAALEYAVNKGVVVVVSAGNEHLSLDDVFMAPASYSASIPGLISVGSVDVINSERSRFSNYSPRFVKLAAPGAIDSHRYIGLVSTLPGNRYGRMQGTSMAAPIVSGAALFSKGVLQALGRSNSPAEVEAWLKRSARSITGLKTQVEGGRVLSMSGLVQGLSAKSALSPSQEFAPVSFDCL